MLGTYFVNKSLKEREVAWTAIYIDNHVTARESRFLDYGQPYGVECYDRCNYE